MILPFIFFPIISWTCLGMTLNSSKSSLTTLSRHWEWWSLLPLTVPLDICAAVFTTLFRWAVLGALGWHRQTHPLHLYSTWLVLWWSLGSWWLVFCKPETRKAAIWSPESSMPKGNSETAPLWEGVNSSSRSRASRSICLEDCRAMKIPACSPRDTLRQQSLPDDVQ